MNRVYRRAALIAILVQTCFLLILPAAGQEQRSAAAGTRPRRIAVFGSSVAFGTGDEFDKEGYTGWLREMLAPRGWQVFNQSRPGDTTRSMATRFAPSGEPDPDVRYLVTVEPGYVVIALALTNEGILEAGTKEAKEAVFNQYAEGIRGFIDRSRQNNIVPIVGLVYPRMSYTPVEYEYARRMNLLQNTWDVPSVNLMGAVDDGTGRYVIGFDADDRHPNAAGHRELSYAFVPSLFEALERGKPRPVRPDGDRGFARVSGSNAAFVFEPQDTMHSFAMSFVVRAQGDGTVASISGYTLSATTETKRGRGAGFASTTLTPAGESGAAILAQNGKWTYKAAEGAVVSSPVSADGKWHHILLSHYTARGETLFFVDGKLAGTVSERLQPRRFVLGGPDNNARNLAAPRQADYKDLFVYRSALNADEAAALAADKVLQASLEVYAPLVDSRFAADSAAENRAQSLSVVKVGAGRIAHVNR